MMHQKKKNDREIMVSPADYFRKAAMWLNKPVQIGICIYMILIMAVMPFYFTKGYGRIGTDKYEFFYKVTTITGKIILPVLGIYLLLLLISVIIGYRQIPFKQTGKDILCFWKRQFSVTDGFAFVYGISLILSYAYTAYKDMTPYGNAWKGANGWYMGLSAQLLFLGIYFVVSRFWKPQRWLLLLWIPVTFAVYFLGYCNRFSVYPIEMEYARPAYISTIGNINWYCGYVVTIFFGILYYWWAGTENRKWMKWPLAVYSLMGFSTLVTQSSSSGLMTLAVILFVLFLMSARDGEKMQQFWLIALILSAACMISWLLRYCFPDSVQQADTLTDLLTTSALPFAILLFSLFMYIAVYITNRSHIYPAKLFAVTGKIFVGMGMVMAILLVAGIVANTLHPGSLGKWSDLGIFTFDKYWGSRRGATYWAGFQSWWDQGLLKKIIGLGPDSMAMYIHAGDNPAMREVVAELWGKNAMLTNAHNEWLTILVNEGILGAIGFVGMISSGTVRFLKTGKKNVIAGACGICILAYSINNIVSFQQAMSTTVMFLILGIGEAFVRREAGWQEQCNGKKDM